MKRHYSLAALATCAMIPARIFAGPTFTAPDATNAGANAAANAGSAIAGTNPQTNVNFAAGSGNMIVTGNAQPELGHPNTVGLTVNPNLAAAGQNVTFGAEQIGRVKSPDNASFSGNHRHVAVNEYAHTGGQESAATQKSLGVLGSVGKGIRPQSAIASIEPAKTSPLLNRMFENEERKKPLEINPDTTQEAGALPTAQFASMPDGRFFKKVDALNANPEKPISGYLRNPSYWDHALILNPQDAAVLKALPLAARQAVPAYYGELREAMKLLANSADESSRADAFKKIGIAKEALVAWNNILYKTQSSNVAGDPIIGLKGTSGLVQRMNEALATVTSGKVAFPRIADRLETLSDGRWEIRFLDADKSRGILGEVVAGIHTIGDLARSFLLPSLSEIPGAGNELAELEPARDGPRGEAFFSRRTDRRGIFSVFGDFWMNARGFSRGLMLRLEAFLESLKNTRFSFLPKFLQRLGLLKGNDAMSTLMQKGAQNVAGLRGLPPVLNIVFSH